MRSEPAGPAPAPWWAGACANPLMPAWSLRGYCPAHRAVALDVTAACAGWVFGARVAQDWLLQNTGARYAAAVGVDVFSRHLNPEDRSAAVLFGDNAAASLLVRWY